MQTESARSNLINPVLIPVGGFELAGDLTLPKLAKGLVVFAHGSGSSRFSARNQYVANVLSDAGLGTLLMDLLTQEEQVSDEHTRALRFDIDMLANRVVQVIDWLAKEKRTHGLKIGLFGASTGAAAALKAAASREKHVSAVVSRGGRPDLAHEALPKVLAPTLLIVGGKDHEVLILNEQALEEMQCHRKLTVVQGATHLFEEPGTLETVAMLARGWFSSHLR